MRPSRLDALLIGVLLLSSLGIFLGVKLVSAAGTQVEVYRGETLLHSLPLHKERLLPVNSQQGRLVLQIKDGAARITEVDCPRQVCRSMGPISQAGQAMICLPNQIIVKIRKTHESDLDATTE